MRKTTHQLQKFDKTQPADSHFSHKYKDLSRVRAHFWVLAWKSIFPTILFEYNSTTVEAPRRYKQQRRDEENFRFVVRPFSAHGEPKPLYYPTHGAVHYHYSSFFVRSTMYSH